VNNGNIYHYYDVLARVFITFCPLWSSILVKQITFWLVLGNSPLFTAIHSGFVSLAKTILTHRDTSDSDNKQSDCLNRR